MIIVLIIGNLSTKSKFYTLESTLNQGRIKKFPVVSDYHITIEQYSALKYLVSI